MKTSTHEIPAATKNALMPGIPFFQPRLSINQPNNIYEQQSDAMADQIMRMNDNHIDQQSFFKPSIVNIRRKCDHCEEEQRQLHRREINQNAVTANASTENYISSLNGKGRVLTQNERSFFEPRFGYNFSDVQLHTNSEANESAKNINALAYTHGNNVVFGANQYKPDTENGKRLMAHELTHVIQQAAGIQRTLQSIQRISDNDSPEYEDAERKEAKANIQTKASGNIVVQRLSARQSSGGTDLTANNVAPWGGANPTGDDYREFTDGGSAVPAWVAINYRNEAERYWCHGHSLGTYSRWLYSVYSGSPLQTTLADEYTRIPEANVQNGDVAVWEPAYGHSCKIESVAKNGSSVDVNNTVVSTKNGRNPLAGSSLINVIQAYAGLNSSVGYYRHK